MSFTEYPDQWASQNSGRVFFLGLALYWLTGMFGF